MGRKNKRSKRKHSAILHGATTALVNGTLTTIGAIPGTRSVAADSNDDSDASDDDDAQHPHDASVVAISEADMATTLRVLGWCAHNPALISRDLRKALHPLVVRQMHAYEPARYGKRVTESLQGQRWGDALLALEACRDFQQLPKQGTVQRWVRDASNATNPRTGMRLLTAILRLTALQNGEDTASANVPSFADNNDVVNLHDPARQLTLLKEQQQETSSKTTTGAESNDADSNVIILPGWTIPRSGDQHTLLAKEADNELSLPAPTASRVLYREGASQRTPPNHHDLLLHYCDPGYMQWQTPAPTVRKTNVPFVPGAFVLSGVLSTRECHLLRRRAELLGFRPDHPTSMTHPTGIDSCEWYVDCDSVLHPLLERVRPHLPETLPIRQGVTVEFRGINARWRFFRYGPNCVYRPHVDGSWPESTIDADGNYCCADNSGSSSSTTNHSATKSYLTFLVYLNDDFDGGETRFYQASASGGMTARGVVPQAGAVLCFPQGNMASLIHEGSAVTSGNKFVIRTDVLYRPTTEEMNDHTVASELQMFTR
jgi:2OG-Fe(II) oxygenase superfamily